MQMNRESPKGLVTELRGRNGVTEMKVKHFLSGATLLSAALLLNAPLSAAVESDVVGYTTIEMQAGKWYILGNPFVALDDSSTYKLNDLFTGEGFHANDKLYLLTDGLFVSFYWNDAHKGWSKHPVIWQEDSTEYPASTAVYLNKNSLGQFTFSGKVKVQPIEIGEEDGNSWTLTALNYPAPSTLSEYEWSNFSTGDELYTLDVDGVFTSHYWNSSRKGWSKHPVIWQEDPKLLSSGEAVYLHKKSTGKGVITRKQSI